MSGELTQAGANRAIQAGVGQQIAASAGMYVALATSLPGTPDTASLADFTANEMTTAGYGRQATTWDSPTGDPSMVDNPSNITFGPFEADPPSVEYAFLCDTSTGSSGTALAHWTFEAAVDGADADSYQFNAGELRLSLD